MTDITISFEQDALIDRLTTGLDRRRREVVFLVGAPLSAPRSPDEPGVPGVDGMISLIKDEFAEDANQKVSFERMLSASSGNQYQAAFSYLQGRRGQETSNEIVRKAVWLSRSDTTQQDFIHGSEDSCSRYDLDDKWHLSPATASLGRLAALHKSLFGRSIITTNFDPLLGVAIRRSSGEYFRSVLHRDGNIGQTIGTGCHVIHLHGYWYGSDTLHTGRQLSQSRPRLKASLSSLLRDKIVVVCGYSGWDDVFTGALIDLVSDDAASPEVLWSFYSPSASVESHLAERLQPGLDRGRVVLYKGIDCHSFIPELARWWEGKSSDKSDISISFQTPFISVSNIMAVVPTIQNKTLPQVIEGDDEDRPPAIDQCLGRNAELSSISETQASLIFITGIGGQGKSTVAAEHFNSVSKSTTSGFDLCIWRDCKEEHERFENQLIAVVGRLTNGSVSRADLAGQNNAEIVQIFLKKLEKRRALLVFDNVDSYVDLERKVVTGTLALMLNAMLERQTSLRILFTCRPDVIYDSSEILSIKLDGLDLEATRALINTRNPSATDTAILEAFRITKGHAFWLDLLAIQAQRRVPYVSLDDLVAEIELGEGELPKTTLNSIWHNLQNRQRIVLRCLAETVKPETPTEVSRYLRSEQNANRTIKALNSLRSLNLIVVKRRAPAEDLLELHPIIRAFVRQLYPRHERLGFIEEIIKVYTELLQRLSRDKRSADSLTTLQAVIENAELCIAAGQMSRAAELLSGVAGQHARVGHAREFLRVTGLFFDSLDIKNDWNEITPLDNLVQGYADVLGNVGAFAKANSLLDSYADTIVDRDARFIRLCNIRCHLKWQQQDFRASMEWGERGLKLLEHSDADLSSNIDHSLALAYRDGGRPEMALPKFLMTRTLQEVLNETRIESSSGAYYGNIGRSLYKMGQTSDALKCYLKSAMLIENEIRQPSVINQGFIRLWIGEALLAQKEYALAYAFLKVAQFKWENCCPARVGEVEQALSGVPAESCDSESSPVLLDQICVDWFSKQIAT